MEDTLRELGQAVTFKGGRVLILVLMEDTLRGAVEILYGAVIVS